MSRALILHAAAHWPQGIDSSLWPMAVSHAVHIYNHTPDAKGIFPADIYTGSLVPRHRLKDYHTWGCPVYVLDPSLQSGEKLPRWQPRSRLGVFMGLSAIHSSEVPLVLNTTTGSITSQYHVVFDNEFSTVKSIEREIEPPPLWDDLCLENTTYIPVEVPANQPIHLPDDWLTEEERVIKLRDIARREEIRGRLDPTTKGKGPNLPPLVNPNSVSSSGPANLIPQPDPLTTADETVVVVGQPLPSIPTAAPINPVPTSNIVELPDPIEPTQRSQRANRGTFSSKKFFDEVFLTPLDRVKDLDGYTKQLVYLASMYVCNDTGLENITDPRMYLAKSRTKKDNPDMPSFQQAMHGPDVDEWIKAMQFEVATLVQQNTWTPVQRTKEMNVLKGTWAFKLKRLPDGTPTKFKARFCARGDLQQVGVDFFDTYAPVVQWSTIRLLLSTVLTESWATRQVDYTNASAQAAINEEVYLEYPKLFGPKSCTNLVLKLLKSLYGLRQAPRTFFEKLREGLLERGYVQSQLDPCLFLKNQLMCVVYVDDTIFAGPDSAALEEEIAALGVSATTQRHSFQLRNEGEVGAFLGIQIAKTGPNTFYLSQPGLIDKVLATSGMTDCNGVDTPTGLAPLGRDIDGLPFSETWEYRTIVGMLMYVSANTRPDIAYAVHQAARFSHAPHNCHAIAIKRILRYLQRTKDKGLELKPNEQHKVDCYVDADFADAFASEDPTNPESVKSRTS